MEAVDVRDRLNGVVGNIDSRSRLPVVSSSADHLSYASHISNSADTHHTTAKVGLRFAFHSLISCRTAWSYSAARASILRRVQSPKGPGSIAHEHSTGRCGSGGRWVLLSVTLRMSNLPVWIVFREGIYVRDLQYADWALARVRWKHVGSCIPMLTMSLAGCQFRCDPGNSRTAARTASTASRMPRA